LLLLLLLSLALSPAQAAVQRILVLGDSLSAAYGIPREQGWVSLLQQRLAARGLEVELLNASISGETTYGALTRLPEILRRFKADLLITELGGNDGLRGLNLGQTRRNLEAIIAQSRQAGARVILLGMMLPPNFGPAYGEKFHQIYLDLAERHQLPLVPFFLQGVAQRREWMQSDGIHPNAAGQTRLLENVWPLIEPLLEDR